MIAWLQKRLGPLFNVSATRGGAVLRDNLGAVITGTVKGSVVICNGVRYPLNLQIPLIDNPEPTIEGLLGWRSRVPRQLIGRDEELQRLLDWAEADKKVRVGILHGAGGAGKSRLAFELAEQLREQGWSAGLLPDPAKPVAYRLSEAGTLLIIDYPEQYPEALDNLLLQLGNSETPDARLRILLLCRTPQQMSAVVNERAPGLLSLPVELKLLADSRHSWALFQAAWADMARLRQAASKAHEQMPPLPLDFAGFEHWLASAPQHASPLIVLAFALNLLDAPQATQLTAEDILSALVDRECKRISRECKAHGLQAEALILLKALAAVDGQLQAEHIDSLASQLTHPGIRLPSALDLKRTSLWQHNALAELQPDLLAANLLYRKLHSYLSSASARGEWLYQTLALGKADSISWRRRLSRLARLSIDRPRTGTNAGKDSLINSLAACMANQPADPTCAEALNQTTLEYPLHPLAIANLQAQLGSEALTPTEQAKLLNNLSVRLAENGQREAALVAIKRAVVIREKLAEDNFAAYAPNLAMSLNNLSIRLAEAGKSEEALACLRRAIEMIKPFARTGTIYADWLATMERSLAERSGE